MTTIQIRTAPALALAAVALVVASTGGAVAGSKITGAQIKNSTITGVDVKDQSLSASDLAASTLPALRGPAGPAGAAGAPGAPGAAGAPGPATLAGYQIIEGTITIPTGSSDAISRSCPAGKVPISVHGYTNPVIVAVAPYTAPGGSTSVSASNTTGASLSLSIQLFCATGTR